MRALALSLALAATPAAAGSDLAIELGRFAASYSQSFSRAFCFPGSGEALVITSLDAKVALGGEWLEITEYYDTRAEKFFVHVPSIASATVAAAPRCRLGPMASVRLDCAAPCLVAFDPDDPDSVEAAENAPARAAPFFLSYKTTREAEAAAATLARLSAEAR